MMMMMSRPTNIPYFSKSDDDYFRGSTGCHGYVLYLVIIIIYIGLHQQQIRDIARQHMLRCFTVNRLAHYKFSRVMQHSLKEYCEFFFIFTLEQIIFLNKYCISKTNLFPKYHISKQYRTFNYNSFN